MIGFEHNDGVGRLVLQRAPRSNAFTSEMLGRTAEILERIGAAYRHEPVERVPALVGDVNYWITGEDPALIPPPNPSMMLKHTARPSPVPPYLRVVDASACWKA